MQEEEQSGVNYVFLLAFLLVQEEASVPHSHMWYTAVKASLHTQVLQRCSSRTAVLPLESETQEEQSFV